MLSPLATVVLVVVTLAGALPIYRRVNLMPRHLPRYGMAPQWARATRPMVLVFTAVAFLVTWIFDAWTRRAAPTRPASSS
jgi:hypothetical protein